MSSTQFEPIQFSAEEQQKQDNEARELVSHLLELTESVHDAKINHIRKIENVICGTDIPILSWRFSEWDYYSKKIELPTQARGLFTTKEGVIICRGYDKFFNFEELSSVKEEELRNNTKGPYTVTVKSNGCIVFISGLANGKLVVCSKHSTGTRTDLSRNHAMVAQEALEVQLKKYGKSLEDLGKLLHKYRITAVCEYCDDRFEEHVLEYKENKAGLYLHGLNMNTVEFKTYPMEKVQQFAEMFGFRETKFRKLDTFDQTLQFLKDSNKTGKFEGEEIEGFVVRCSKMVDEKANDFFFKYKFEEPYLLYRELREITKQFITQGPENLKFGKHKLICMDYMKYIMPYLVTNEKLKQEYLENKGIIELRKRYFESKNTTSMQLINDELDMIDLEEEMKKLKFGKSKPNRYVLVTLSTIGCGKTTTSVGVSNLFPEIIEHIQNDNIQSPGKDKLVLAALEVLSRKPVVIMDKNNHKTVERKQIFDGFQRLNNTIPKSKLKFICLNFIQRPPKGDKDLWDLTRERVYNRGDSHQSIKVEKDGIGNAEKIMRGFISRFQPLNTTTEPDCNFDYIIDLDVHQDNSSLQNMKKIVTALQSCTEDLDLKTPTEADYVKAFEKAKLYKPTFSKKISATKRKPVYFAIDVPQKEIIMNLMNTFNIDFFSRLVKGRRVQQDFHVTLVHSAMRKQNDTKKEFWDTYSNIFKSDISRFADTKTDIPQNKRCFLSGEYSADIQLEKVVWDSKAMCIQVKILGFQLKDEPIKLPCGIDFSHLTIGTIDKNFPPVLSGVMLKHLYGNDEKEVSKIQEIKLSEEIVLTRLPLYVFMN